LKASGKIGSNGVKVSDNVEKRFEPDIYIHTSLSYLNIICPAVPLVRGYGTLPTVLEC